MQEQKDDEVSEEQAVVQESQREKRSRNFVIKDDEDEST